MISCVSQTLIVCNKTRSRLDLHLDLPRLFAHLSSSGIPADGGGGGARVNPASVLNKEAINSLLANADTVKQLQEHLPGKSSSF